MIRAIVLDFDGLILDTESALIDSYADVYGMHGIAFDRAEFIRSVGQAEYAFDPWHPFGRTADRLALEAERSRRNRERGRLLSPLPGIVSLFDAARAAGLRVGVASNSGHSHVDGHLARLGLLDRVHFVGCREDVASPKPEPDLYRLVMDRFGLRGPEGIAFEDSNPGSLAARRAGLWVVAVPNAITALHDFSHVDLRVTSLAEVTLTDLIARFAAPDAV